MKDNIDEYSSYMTASQNVHYYTINLLLTLNYLT